MVRLGLGLYGIDSSSIISDKLLKVHTLTSTIIQIKELKKGDAIGYNRKTVLQKDSRVGVINIGYADGLMRNISNEKYAVKIGDVLAPILGNISMDLTIIDLTYAPDAKVGTEVVIFDQSHPLENLADAADTIPYEVLSRISERVERRYIRG